MCVVGEGRCGRYIEGRGSETFLVLVEGVGNKLSLEQGGGAGAGSYILLDTTGWGSEFIIN